jgi:tRNA(Arg) A34 adenosine deaminase TadA
MAVVHRETANPQLAGGQWYAAGMIERRTLLSVIGCTVAGHVLPASSALALSEREQQFVAEAVRMKSEAVAKGDQPYGAVLVRDGTIIGYGPSRVVTDRNPDAHAERVALWDAQRRSGSRDLAGSVMYSTSRPCSACQRALALAKVERMYFGPAATDSGRPQQGGI